LSESRSGQECKRNREAVHCFSLFASASMS
jgi:hypothetical protein